MVGGVRKTVLGDRKTIPNKVPKNMTKITFPGLPSLFATDNNSSLTLRVPYVKKGNFHRRCSGLENTTRCP